MIFWAAPDWALNVFNIHKQLYTVQLGRQRCTGLSDRSAWLSTWDPADDWGVGWGVSVGQADERESVQRMTFIRLQHYVFTRHPITATINWLSYLSSQSLAHGLTFLLSMYPLKSVSIFMSHLYRDLFICTLSCKKRLPYIYIFCYSHSFQFNTLDNLSIISGRSLIQNGTALTYPCLKGFL